MDAFRCLRMTSGYTAVTTRSVAEIPQDTPGQHRDASGCLKDAPDGYMDLAETCGDSRMGFTDLYFSRRCQLIGWGFL